MTLEIFYKEQQSLRDKQHELLGQLSGVKTALNMVQTNLHDVAERIRKEKDRLQNKIEPSVSDHALIRYFERKYKVDFSDIRKEILTPLVVDAIRAGAFKVRVGGIEFRVVGGVIVTAVD